MKISSEFYLEELFHVMRGINMQIEDAGYNIRKANRRHTILCLLMPWKRSHFDAVLLEEAANSMKLTALLGDIADKVMEAQGRDEDGEFVSLRDMIVLSGGD